MDEVEKSDFIKMFQFNESESRENIYITDKLKPTVVRIVNGIGYIHSEIENNLQNYYGSRLQLHRKHSQCAIGEFCKPCGTDCCMFIGSSF